MSNQPPSQQPDPPYGAGGGQPPYGAPAGQPLYGDPGAQPAPYGAPGGPGGYGGPGAPGGYGYPPSGGGGGKKGLVIGSVIVVLLLVVGIAVALWLVLRSDGDAGGQPQRKVTITTTVPAPGTTDATDGGSSSDGTATDGLPAQTPSQVVDAFLAAVSDGDCDTATDLVSQSFLDENGDCDDGMPSTFTWTIDDETITDSENAVVDATLTDDSGDQAASFAMVVVDGSWKVDSVS